ncbi:AAA family ATPase [Kitasatospora sp. NPDC059327]|uniref:helix-turn-helix transcriptional regulator n=1 Tax=Kitasatospora sp. NPDC059327 TaxID=3346803 RepID=UPI0036919085
MRVRAAHLIGRDAEVAKLGDSLRDLRRSYGGTTFLVGEGGIGKSRLVAEVIGAAVDAGVRVLRGRSSTIGPMVPLRPLTEALMPLSRGGETPDEASLGPYRPVLGRLIPDWGTGTPEQGSTVVLAEAVLRLLASAGREQGCLLVLEDLHDADTETLAVVEYLVDNLEQQPAMLVATVRSEPGEALLLAESAGRRRSGTVFRLAPLDGDEVDRLIASCLDTEPGLVPAEVLTQIREDSAGIPFLVEELLQGAVTGGALVRENTVWRVAGNLRRNVPRALLEGAIHRIDELGPQGQTLLSAAAVLGRRFPLSVLQLMTGADDRSLLSHLHASVTARLVAADEPAPDWYAFQHPLTAEALLAQLTPTARAALSHQAADAIEALHPELQGDWCPLAATLRADAGDQVRAGRLFTEAGRRALANGTVGSAVALLDRAERLLAAGTDSAARAEALEALLPALAETGELTRALSLAGSLRELVGAGLGAPRLAALHTRLAQVAYMAGRWADGNNQIERARALLGPDPDEAHTALTDVVEAYLCLDTPGQDRTQRAERLARAAIDTAERHDQPLAACQAWELLGVVARERDLAEAITYLERAMSTAERHSLPLQRMYALTRLGGSRWLADGGTATLEEARTEARRLGAVTVVYTLDGILALHDVLCGRFAEARALGDEALTMAARLRLAPVARYLLMTRSVLAAHQGDRAAMEEALTEFGRWGGSGSPEEPLALGLARVFCALLEEDRDRAARDMAGLQALEAENPSTFHLGGRHGLGLLLDLLDGRADRERLDRVAASSAGRMRWNRHFVLLAEAVLLGREGEPEAAGRAAQLAQEVGAPYPTARHLGQRLIADEAHALGWGDPEGWLREAEHHFRETSATAVVGACRTLLRAIGAPVRQHRTGTNRIPAQLRLKGMTVREYEIFQLLADRLSNKDIAARLYISPRTVEKHVASLIAKTGLPNRAQLCALAAQQS